MKTYLVSIFKNGSNQAVRIPRELEFPGVTELIVTRDGDHLVLKPNRPTWESLEGLQPIIEPIDRPSVIDFGTTDPTKE